MWATAPNIFQDRYCDWEETWQKSGQPKGGNQGPTSRDQHIEGLTICTNFQEHKRWGTIEVPCNNQSDN